jgi:hypothetical protein
LSGDRLRDASGVTLFVGARAYRYLALYEPSPGCLVEIGSERGEGSTAWLADYATRTGLRFYTVDIDPKVYATAKRITNGARLGQGRELIPRLKNISIAYLDGFDWVRPGDEDLLWVANQRARYFQLGHIHSNEASEAEHLAEAQLVVSKAHRRCVIICDDTHRYARGWRGKGRRAIPFLKREGFEVIDYGEMADQSLGYVVMRRG